MTTRGTHIPFMKMHGLGNDFVVIDERGVPARATRDMVRAMADRHRGIGFDQLVTIHDHPTADMQLVFYNADGSTAGACGNATRCVAGWDMQRSGARTLRLQTERGTLQADDLGRGLVQVNMGAPLLDWQDIPLSQPADTLELPIDGAPTATSMGNPHCSFFVEDVAAIDLERFGPTIETHPLFPERTNVQIAQITAPDTIRMRVWERGVGTTLASGSSSCAVAVAAARRGLTGRKVTVELDGGTLVINWDASGVLMTGAWAHVFDGTWFVR